MFQIAEAKATLRQEQLAREADHRDHRNMMKELEVKLTLERREQSQLAIKVLHLCLAIFVDFWTQIG